MIFIWIGIFINLQSFFIKEINLNIKGYIVKTMLLIWCYLRQIWQAYVSNNFGGQNIFANLKYVFLFNQQDRLILQEYFLRVSVPYRVQITQCYHWKIFATNCIILQLDFTYKKLTKPIIISYMNYKIRYEIKI